jgi:spore coat polysaccharide biosynthesis protein SpsF
MMTARRRLGIVVFARWDSKRLPGKALLPICGRPMLGHVLARLRRVPKTPAIIVATSDRKLDDGIAAFSERERATCFRGDALDVTRRALDCANSFDLTDIARISGDSPFIDPDVVARVIAAHEAEHPDITTNVHPRTFPFGCSVEVIATSALARAFSLTSDGDDREHVTNYFYHSEEQFRIRNVAAGHNRFLGVRLAVDTVEDLSRAEWIASRTKPSPVVASLDEIVALAKSWATENAMTNTITVRS